jgi:hypothetical protein
LASILAPCKFRVVTDAPNKTRAGLLTNDDVQRATEKVRWEDGVGRRTRSPYKEPGAASLLQILSSPKIFPQRYGGILE